MAADEQGRRIKMGRFRPNMDFTKVRGNHARWSPLKSCLPIEQGELIIQITIENFLIDIDPTTILVFGDSIVWNFL